jgi:hypothetical protein
MLPRSHMPVVDRRPAVGLLASASQHTWSIRLISILQSGEPHLSPMQQPCDLHATWKSVLSGSTPRTVSEKRGSIQKGRARARTLGGKPDAQRRIAKGCGPAVPDARVPREASRGGDYR